MNPECWVKILGLKKSQRYVMRRLVISAQEMICKENPAFVVNISEAKTSTEILTYTPILAAPSLIVGESLVCKGRIPSRDEVVGWLYDAKLSTTIKLEQSP